MNETVANSDGKEKTTKSETLASSVYNQLMDDILAGRLRPGHKLRLQPLQKDYNVGNSPLREALNRLSANGLVVREENKGFRVSPASVVELEELVRTRHWLEEIALRESIRNADEAYDERIVLAFHRLSRISPNKDGSYSTPEQEDKHKEFHQALLSACQSNLLLGYCAQMHEQILRYQNLAEVVQYREEHVNDEHRAIHDAVLARDADKAVELLNSHFQIAADIVISCGELS